MGKETLVIADIDYSIKPGYAIIDFAEHLVNAGMFDEEEWMLLVEGIEKYKRKEMLYDDFADHVVEKYCAGLKGQSVEKVEYESEKFWEERFESLYAFTVPMFEYLRSIDSRVIAVSGSSIESLKPLLSLLEFSEVITTLARSNQGIFDGEIELNMASHKYKNDRVAEIFDGLSEDVLTVGIGDSVADLSFLRRVDIQIVIGRRDNKLLAEAVEKGWKVVVEPETESIDFEKLLGSHD